MYLLANNKIWSSSLESAEIASFKVDKYLKDDNIIDINNNTKRLSTWQQQQILFLRAFICIKRDSVSKSLKYNVFNIYLLLGKTITIWQLLL